MYVWIWRHIPGGWPGKLIGSLVLFLGACALLLFVVFPHIQDKLPFNDVTIDRGSHSSSSPSPSPSP
jgi:hypothetical protein